MRIKTLLAAAAAAFLAFAAPANAEGLSEAEQQQVRDIVRDYLMANPQLVYDALKELEARQERAAEEARRMSLVEYRDEIFNVAGDPVVGPDDAAVTVVEFFDYKCSYCKRVVDSIANLRDKAPDVRIVFKEFPILSEESLYAARAALAARKQDLYMPFHLALMRARGTLSERTVMRLAESVGLDAAQLKTDMASPEVDVLIERNYRVAEALGIRGTPAFIIGDQVVPGAISEQQMLQLIAAARAS